MTKHIDQRFTELTDFYPEPVRIRLRPHERMLGSNVALTHDGKIAVRLTNGHWSMFSKVAPAVNAIVQHWGGLATDHKITDKTVHEFVTGDNLAPVVRGFMSVPTSDAPAVEFRGETWINSWDASAIAVPDAVAFAAPELQDILTKTVRMLRENLCARPRLDSLDAMLTAAQSDAEDELEWRFLMSWLAKPLQSLGYNMQTNCWLLGSINGLGRGTLTTAILPLLYGRSNVVELQAADVEHGGWTDTLKGKLLIIINELTVNGRFDWNAFIKSNSCEPILRIRERREHPYDSLNFGNWLFTSNADEPRCLDSKDRRNALIQCFNKMDEPSRIAACGLALEVYQWIRAADEPLRRRYAGALMHMFATHPVDERLIAFAPSTLLKEDVQSATSADIKGLYWLQNDDAYPRDEVEPAIAYLEYYNRFAGSRGATDARGMGGIMSGLSRRGLVIRHKKYETKAAYWEVDSDLFPRASDVDEDAKQRAKDKVVSIAGLLPGPRRR